MLHVSNILIPVDFSRGSLAALTQAYRLAEATQASMRCVHVVPPMMHYMRSILFPFAALGNEELALEAELREGATESLERYLFADKGKEGKPALEVQMALEGHSAAEMLLERISEVEGEMVFIGSSGESGEAPGRLGSILEQVVSRCPRPTFIARTSEQGRSIKRVAAALDLSDLSGEVFARALEAALIYEASLRIFVVIPDPRNQDIGGLVGSSLKMAPKAIRNKVERDVHKKLARIRNDVQVPFPWKKKRAALARDEKDIVLFGDPAEQLIQAVGEHNTDLLVFGRTGYQRTGLRLRTGRCTRTLLGHAPCHMMVVASAPEAKKET